jgi:hypothetical protein
MSNSVKLGKLTVVLALAVSIIFGITISGCSSGSNKVMSEESTGNTVIQPTDKAGAEEIQTATFALG